MRKSSRYRSIPASLARQYSQEDQPRDATANSNVFCDQPPGFQSWAEPLADDSAEVPLHPLLAQDFAYTVALREHGHDAVKAFCIFAMLCRLCAPDDAFRYSFLWCHFTA